MKRRRSVSPGPRLNIKPAGFRSVVIPSSTSIAKIVDIPLTPPTPWVPPPAPTPIFQQGSKQDIAAVIAAASAKAEQAAKQAAAEAAVAEAERLRKEEKDAELAKRKAAKAKKQQSREEKESLKEKRLLKLVGAVVVKVMSKYQNQMDHDSFKKHAKEVRSLLFSAMLSPN